MTQEPAPIYAAIDIGSNTIHIVVARCFPTTLEILADELEMVRIGESVSATGEISEAKAQQALQTLHAYRALAEEHEARQILVVATEAIRQARNREAFCARVKEETGLEVRLISGSTEAELTFLGATYETGFQDRISVMDLGGGSMELVFASQMQISWRTSIPLGSGWLHDHYLTDNPPTSAHIQDAQDFVKKSLRQLHLKASQVPLIVTGGSANSLLRLAQQAFHLPPERKTLTREDLARCQNLLSALAAEDIASLYAQPLGRAKVLLAGTLIIRRMMKLLKVQEITVSQHGIREGALLAYTRADEQGLTEPEKGPAAARPQAETFAHSAHEVLHQRLQAMLSWSEAVRKHEDSEAVHKMRVASRRLRAALDAYEVCCEPRYFKRVYRQVKKAAQVLGEARDADVMLASLSAQLETLTDDEEAGVRWLQARLEEYRQEKQEHLDHFLHTFKAEQLEHNLYASLRERMDR